jgi:hypothetical protein
MTFSRPVLGRSKMSWFEYYVGHVFPTGLNSIVYSFRIWCDLMTDNYEGYGLLKDDDPFTECCEWFWVSLSEDDTYPKEFLEDLYEMCDRIDRGEEKVYPMTLDDLQSLSDLIDDTNED